MEIAVDKMGDVAVAALPVEELDASNAGEFKRDIAPVLEANTKLVLDLSRLRFVDSSGLGALISCLRQLNAKGGDLKLCGMSKQVRAVFELVRMHRIFDIYGTQRRSSAGISVVRRERSVPHELLSKVPTTDAVSCHPGIHPRVTPRYSLGKAWRDLSPRDLFTAVALSVRDQMVDRMLETEERYQQQRPQAPVLSFDRVSDRPVARKQSSSTSDARVLPAGPAQSRSGFGSRSKRAKQTPLWAMAGSAGWPLAFWTRSPPWGCLDTAMASITSMASSSRRSTTDISARNRTTGSRRALPGKSPAPMKPAWFPSMAASSTASIARAATTRCGWTGKS